MKTIAVALSVAGLAVVGLSATSSAALAQTGGAPVTLADMQARAEEQFRAADFDQSGVLSTTELARAAQENPMAGRRLGMADANGDGRVTLAEFQAGVAAMFARLDLNGDGAISPEERAQARGMNIGTGMLGQPNTGMPPMGN